MTKRSLYFYVSIILHCLWGETWFLPPGSSIFEREKWWKTIQKRQNGFVEQKEIYGMNMYTSPNRKQFVWNTKNMKTLRTLCTTQYIRYVSGALCRIVLHRVPMYINVSKMKLEERSDDV